MSTAKATAAPSDRICEKIRNMNRIYISFTKYLSILLTDTDFEG